MAAALRGSLNHLAQAVGARWARGGRQHCRRHTWPLPRRAPPPQPAGARPLRTSAAAAAGGMAAEAASCVQHADMLRALQAVVPDLTTDSYKGQHGKVGVMGGCREYTGAPFFAAMSAMRMGCDLAYVFCTPGAAPVIKGYSPELIVIPTLLERDALDKMSPGEARAARDAFSSDLTSWLGRLSALVIGPGLGEDPQVGECMYQAVQAARELQLPLLIDGSGLNFLAKRPELVRGYTGCVLTPNVAELGRLAQAVGLELRGKIGVQWQQHAHELAAALGGPVLLSKGPQDVISDGTRLLVVRQEGSPRRCGGQGDVLTGTTATFISWIRAHERTQQQQQQGQQQQGQQQQGQQQPRGGAAALPQLMVAAYGGCVAMRSAAALTFARHGRSMVAGDMIHELGDRVLEHAGLLAPRAQL